MADPIDSFQTEQESMNANESYLTSRAAASRNVTPALAATSSDFVRNNPGVSPDVAAASISLSDLRDHPGMGEIIRRDYKGQGLLMRGLTTAFGPVTRPLTAGFSDVWDLSVSRWQRFAVQQYQNPENHWATNFARAGAGIAGEAAATDTSIGDMLFGGALGTGLIAGRPEDPMTMPGAGKHFENQLKQGEGFDEALSNTEEWVAEKYGANIVQDAWNLADATRLHVTVDGIEYDYGVSAGRIATTPLFQLGYVTPGTVPANLISGSIDFYTQIGMDPMDPLFNSLTRWFSVRKMLRPSALSSTDEVIAAHGGMLLVERPMEGMYHGEGRVGKVTTNRTTAMMADDYIFFGGPAFDAETGMQGGGITHGLERAIGYAKDQAGNEGVVYAINKSALSAEQLKHIEEVGEIEQLVVVGKLSPLEEQLVADTVENIGRLDVEATELERLHDQLLMEMRANDPEFDEFMVQWDEFQAHSDAGGVPVADGEYGAYPGMNLWDYADRHFDQATAARYSDSMHGSHRARRAYRDSVQSAKAQDAKITYSIDQQIEPSLNPEFVPSDWPLDIESAIPVTHAEEMLGDGYFYPGGIEARNAARKYIDEDLGVVKAHGRWEAKDPDKWLGQHKGTVFAEWLANPAVPYAAKIRHLRAKGVPASAAVGMLDEIEQAIRTEARGVTAPRYDAPSSTYNDFGVYDGYGPPEGGIDDLLLQIENILNEFDSSIGWVNGDNIYDLGITMNRFLQVNPKQKDTLLKRMFDIQHRMDVLAEGKLTNRTIDEAKKLDEAKGKTYRDLRELSNDMNKVRQGDAAKYQASLDRHAGTKLDKPFVDATRALRDDLYELADEFNAKRFAAGDKKDPIGEKIAEKSQARTGHALTAREEIDHLEELIDMLETQVRKTGIGNERLVSLRAQLDELRKLEPIPVKNLEEATAQRIRNTESPRAAVEVTKEHLKALVNGRVITRQASKPGRVSRAMSGDTAILSGQSKVRDTPRTFSDWGRRWRAHSTESRIDPWDFDTTFDSITQFLETIRSAPAEIDRIVRLAAANFGDMRGSMLVVDELLMELQKSLEGRGLDEQTVNKIINDYLKEQRQTTLYHIDRAGNPIGETDSMYTLERGAGGLEFKVLMDEPINDAEMSISSIHIPSVRDARRVTSGPRTTLAKLTGYDLKLGPQVIDRYLDGAAAIWRNFQLLRPGWMMSVIPDELGRAAAQGHAELLRNPMFAWRIVMGTAGEALPDGNAVSAISKAQGGLGAGSAARSIKDQPMLAAHAAGKSSWEVKTVVDPSTGLVTTEGAEHIARNFVRLWQSQLYESLYKLEGDVDQTIEWLMQHPDGRLVLQDIAQGQGRGAMPSVRGRIGRATTAPIDEAGAEAAEAALRVNLEAINAEVLLMTGGDWVHRNPDIPGEWLNSGGTRIETYEGINPNTRRPDGTGDKWNARTLWEEILRLDSTATGRTSVGGKPQRVADLKARLMEMQGINEDLTKIPQNQSYVTIRDGDRRLISLIGDGKAEPTSIDMHLATNQAYKRIARSFGFHQENTVLVRLGGGISADGVGTGSYTVYKTPNMARMERVAGEHFVVVDTSKLEPEEYLRFMEAMRTDGPVSVGDLPFEYNPQAMRKLNLETLDAKAQNLFDTGDLNRIFNEMESDDFADLAKFIEREAYVDGVVPPSRVKGPSSIADTRLASMEDSFIDKLFTYLGQKPSEVMVRNPYSRIKTWETFADFYIYATPHMQGKIRAAAEASNIPSKQFDGFIERSLRIAGVKEGKMPIPAKTQLTMQEMQDLAVAKAIQDTRDLFFDLSKRGNWADATKLIFPFGDAWWEVLTRWTGLFNPMKAEEFGRPFKNLHRIQQATMGAERSGWFETNESGDRVFRWFPGAALATAFMDVPEGFQMRNTASINQMMFIDFSDARSVLAPGMGPYMQIPASVVRPLEGKAVQSWIDWAVFGSFDPGEKDAEGVMNMLIPTYMKKVYKRMQGGAYSEDAASMVVDIANTLYASGDPKYRDVAIDNGVKQQLMVDARRIADTYLWVEMFASAALPLQPRAVTELVNTTTDGTERVVQLTAVADDFHFLNQYMETEQARATVIDWYGEDPTMVAPKSYGVLYRPVTKEGHDFAITHDEFMDQVPFTAAAFMPMTPGEVFYSREYKRQINEGDRQKLTPEESFLYLSYRQGQARFYEVQDEMDRRLEQAETLWGKDSDGYRSYRDDVVKPWYANAKMSLEAMYYGYSSSASGATKMRRRPTSEDLLLEMLAIGQPGSSENEAAREVNVQLTGYIEEISRWWRKNDQISIINGVDASWWYSSATKSDPTPSMLRDQFRHRVTKLIDGIEDTEMKQRVQWYSDSVMTGLMQGYDLDSPFIVDIDPLLAPEG